MGKLLCALIVLLGLTGAAIAQNGPQQEAELVKFFLEKREALLQDGQIDLAALSKEIGSTLLVAKAIESTGRYDLALKALFRLERHLLLSEIPSPDVQLLTSWLYEKQSKPDEAGDYKKRATALFHIFGNALGTSGSPDQPLRMIMVNDLSEWARMRSLRVGEIKPHSHKGKELQVVQVTQQQGDGRPTTVYVEFAKQTLAANARNMSLFDPIPTALLSPSHKASLDVAREKWRRFLDDKTFPYIELEGAIARSLNAAADLDMHGKSADALEKLKDIEAIRPIEDIPTPDLIGFYSALHGRIGDTKKQTELRDLLFGINQVIGSSGAGLRPESAIQVIFVKEEYSWLADKKLTRTSQRILDQEGKKYDGLTAKDAAGKEREYFFDVTAMYPKRLQGLVPNSTSGSGK